MSGPSFIVASHQIGKVNSDVGLGWLCVSSPTPTRPVSSRGKSATEETYGVTVSSLTPVPGCGHLRFQPEWVRICAYLGAFTVGN